MGRERTFIQTIKKFFKPIKNVKKDVTVFIVFASLAALLRISTVEVFRYASTYLESSYQRLFWYAIVVLVLIELIDILQQWFFKKVDYYSEHSIQKEIYEDVMKGFMMLDHNYADKLGTGRLQSIVLNGIERRKVFMYNVLFDGTFIIVTTLGSLVVLFRTDVWVGLLSVFSLLIVFVVFVIRNKGDRRYRTRSKDQMVEIDKLGIMQMMSKFEIIQSDSLNSEISKVKSKIDRLASLNTERGFHSFLAYRGIFSFFNLMQILAYGIAGYFFFLEKLSLPDFFVIALAFRILIGILKDVRSLMRSFSKEYVSIEKIRSTLDDGPKLQGVFDGKDFVSSNGQIQIEDIDFRYEGSEEIFSNLSIKFEGGRKIALVGISGSGKSTLVKLIAGYLRPNSGRIFVDGQDLTEVSLKSYYKHIGYLTQEPNVFDGTIIDNLTYAIDGKVDQKELEECIKLAKCDFIHSFSDGLETEIGERGVLLSGGQRQRLAIAKIFLKNPEIIILDEPTSALDSFSEEAITEAMHNLFENRTVIIIAHRLQTVKNADDIIVLDEGEVIERGTHDELIEKGGSYAKMLELQSGF